MTTIHYNVRFNKKDYDLFKKLAKKEFKSVNSAINELVLKFIEERKAK